jgi:hypothetical protein
MLHVFDNLQRIRHRPTGHRKWFHFVLFSAVIVAACSTAPRVITIPAPSENAPRSVEWLNENYSELLGAISSVMVLELKFPPIQSIVVFYPNSKAFETGLQSEFEDSEKRSGRQAKEPANHESIEFAARQSSVTATAVAINGKVLVQEIAFKKYSWSERGCWLTRRLTLLKGTWLRGGPSVGIVGFQRDLRIGLRTKCSTISRSKVSPRAASESPTASRLDAVTKPGRPYRNSFQPPIFDRGPERWAAMRHTVRE